MDVQEVLPDRGLTDTEFRDLQNQDRFDAVLRDDQGGRATVLFLQTDGKEKIVHYTESEGWHFCDERDLDDPHPPTG